jgi:signal transduction histidine kinase
MRRRLVAAIVGVAAAAVVLFTVPLALVLQRSYRDEDLMRLQRDTVGATRAIDLSTQAGDAVELPRLTATAVAAYDRSGRRVAGRGPARADALTAAALRSGRVADRHGGGRVVVAVPLLAGERVTGALRAERSMASAAHDTREAWLLIGGLGAGVIVLAALAALVIGRRLARPLERLAPAAQRLGDGDFSARAPRAGIAEVDAVAAALDATAHRLDQLLARERAFSADASHQLRTPLAALRLELEAIELQGGPRPELDAALSQVQRLQETIDTLLAVARDADRDGGANTDLAALLEQAQERWHGPLAAEGRPLRTVQQARDPIARVAPGVAREIVDVLVDNARRHGRGAIVLSVREVAGATSGSLAIDVRDDGDGFGEDGAGADDPFARRAADVDGHGIGLALARSLAEAEGARLSISGRGSPTVLTLLVARDR